MNKIKLYDHSANNRRYITRYTQEAFEFAQKFVGNIITRKTPDGGFVYEVWI